jgi:hypothetical protein
MAGAKSGYSQSALLQWPGGNMEYGSSYRLYSATLFASSTARHRSGTGAGLSSAPLSAAGGLTLIAISPPFGLGWWLLATGLLAWALMTASYLPMLRWYSTSPWFALLLPLTVLLYTAMTIDSAPQSWKGTGGTWKGRVYEFKEKTPDGII